MHRMLLAGVAVTLLSCQPKSQAPDDLIVPGVRVGPVARTSTEQALLETLGNDAVKAEADTGEGPESGLMIYKDDPTRRLFVVWNDEKPVLPSIIYICLGTLDAQCRWRTASGIGMRTTLQELEKLNGRAFKMVGWGSDVGGNVVSFEAGKLDQELMSSGRLLVTLDHRYAKEGGYSPLLTREESDAVEGGFILSSHPVLQKLNPYVRIMRLEFPR
jgi:hypothetical protein